MREIIRIAGIICVGVVLASCNSSRSIEHQEATDEEMVADATDDDRLRQVKEGAKRSLEASLEDAAQSKAGVKDMPEKGLHKWIVNLGFSACPEARDWFALADKVRAGNYQARLPSQCFRVEPGTVIIAKDHGLREKATYKDYRAFEKGQLENGRVFWSDELDKMSLSKL